MSIITRKIVYNESTGGGGVPLEFSIDNVLDGSGYIYNVPQTKRALDGDNTTYWTPYPNKAGSHTWMGLYFERKCIVKSVCMIPYGGAWQVMKCKVQGSDLSDFSSGYISMELNKTAINVPSPYGLPVIQSDYQDTRYWDVYDIPTSNISNIGYNYWKVIGTQGNPYMDTIEFRFIGEFTE